MPWPEDEQTQDSYGVGERYRMVLSPERRPYPQSGMVLSPERWPHPSLGSVLLFPYNIVTNLLNHSRLKWMVGFLGLWQIRHNYWDCGTVVRVEEIRRRRPTVGNI